MKVYLLQLQVLAIPDAKPMSLLVRAVENVAMQEKVEQMPVDLWMMLWMVP